MKNKTALSDWVKLPILCVFVTMIVLCAKQDSVTVTAFMLSLVYVNLDRFLDYIDAKRIISNQDKFAEHDAKLARLTLEFERLNAALTFKRER